MQIDDLFYEALLARDNEMMSTCGHKHNISLMECYDVIPFYAKYRLQPETQFKCLLRKALEWLVKLTDVKDFTALEHFDITCAFRNHPQRVMNIVRKNLAPQLSEGRILQIEFARRVGAIVHSLMYTRLFHLGIHFNVTAREDEDRAIRDFSCKVFHAYMDDKGTR